jgi:O-antigen/teichoic acid export membrane protein
MLGSAILMLQARRSAARWRILLGRLAREGVVRNNAIFFVGSVGAGVFGYVFHFAVGRLLGPASYSIVASAVSAVYILTLPCLIVQLVAARFTSVAIAKNDPGALGPLARLLTTVSLVLGGVVAVAIWLGAGWFSGFLQLTDRRVVAILTVSTLLGMLVATNRGLLQGLRRFGALSVNLLVDTSSRVVIGVVLVLAGLGPLGAVAAVIAGPAIAYLQSLAVMGRLSSGSPRERIQIVDVARYAAPTAAAVIGVTYLFNVDIVLARHYLSPSQAGIYAAGAVLARVVYFLGLTIAGVMFPEVASRHARDQSHFHVVDLSLLFLAAVGIVLAAVYALLPGLVLLPYGSQFAPVRPFLGVFAAALTLLALANLLVNYFLSVNSTRFIAPLLGAGVLETVLMVAFHRDVAQFLAMLLVSAAALAGSLALLYAVDRFRPSKPGIEGTTDAGTPTGQVLSSG